MDTCCICNGHMTKLYQLRVLEKYQVQYFHCAGCGFVRTEKPYWLEEAYADAIAVGDTGIMLRNELLSARLACVLYFCFEPRGAFIDVAGGYGILTRLMRDYGFDYFWEDKYCENLVARGFEATKASGTVTAMSAFEVIEHTENPVDFVAQLMERHRCRTLIFSTETYLGEHGPPSDWWYLSSFSGQHISFFEPRTLQRIAERLGVAFQSHAGLHVFSDRPLANRWLLPRLNGLAAPFLARVVRRRLGSRTWPDHLNLTRPAAARDVRAAAPPE